MDAVTAPKLFPTYSLRSMSCSIHEQRVLSGLAIPAGFAARAVTANAGVPGAVRSVVVKSAISANGVRGERPVLLIRGVDRELPEADSTGCTLSAGAGDGPDH